MNISLCMIVKNEEKYIGQCLASAVPVVDEAVIVDTGSCDNTKNIIRDIDGHNIKLIEYQWNNNFSEARNISLENANGDWVLILDADEKLVCNADILYKFLEETTADALYIPIYNILSSGMIEISSGMIRLFKNDGSRYEQAIHEQLIFKNNNVETRVIEDSICKIFHYGYLKSSYNDKDKIKRNTNIIKSEIKKNPNQPFNWYNMGTMKMIDTKYSEALDCFIKSYNLCNGIRYPFINNLLIRMAQCLWSEQKYQSCIDFLSQILNDEELKKIPDLYYYLGYCQKELGLYDDAINNFMICIKIGEIKSGLSLRGMGSYIPMLEWAKTLKYQDKVNEAVMKYMEALFSPYNYLKSGLGELKEYLNVLGMTDVLKELDSLMNIKGKSGETA